MKSDETLPAPPAKPEAVSECDPGLKATIPASDDTEAPRRDVFAQPNDIPNPGGPASPDHLPLALVERFDDIRFLGQGGMGTVYRARDRRLGRDVAIKLIHGGGPEVGRRFLLEARAQARIEHDHICKIHEAGAADGQRFIVMQLINGESLDRAGASMTTEQKVRVLQQVSTALHEAHRTGLIHRDIKPGNIMVERRDDGTWKPYVMDFGLARETETQGHTMAGVISGTPAFMAPEQARGENQALDRRADVYSLGATLYDLLAGRPPFVEPDLWQLLRRVGHDEAPPLRSVSREVPGDLETIVMKCLEHEPQRRYESARALADDLGRYLDGDPILARRASLTYVLVKKAIKHKLAVALSGAALAAAVALIFLWLRAGRVAAEQAELSQQLGKDVKEMELLLRWAYGLPLHNVNREKDHIRDRMQGIERRIERMSEIGAGPGHYAIGRGHLALRDPERAREHLEKALAAEYGGPEVERALGRALGELYKKELEETYRIGDKKPRDERRAVLEKELLQPALRHLRAGSGDELESEAYMEGLIAFYNKQYAEALEKARLSEERALSTYEAKKLRGDVHAALGTEKKEQGQDEQAFADYDRAAAAYEAARTIARSDASIYEAECELWAQRMEIESNLGKSPKSSFEKAQAACDGALAANPESGAAHGKKAWALWQYGGYLLGGGKDPTDVLSKAIEAGKVAVRLDPGDANTYDAMGIAHVFVGLYQMRQGKDPRPSFRLAAENLEKAIELHPNFAWAYNDLGGVHRSVGEYELSHGIDPTESLSKSIAYKKKAIDLNPSYHYPYTNTALAYIYKARYELGTGRDPRESLKLAIDACERSLAITRSYYPTYNAMAVTYRLEAQHRIYLGEAYEEPAQRALQWLAEELRVNPASYSAHLEIALVHHLLAQELLSRGGDPGAPLEKAESALRQMEKIDAGDVQTPLTRAKILLLKARAATTNGAEKKNKKKDAEAAWREAEAAVSDALKLSADAWEVFATGAEIAFWRALASAGAKRPGSEIIKNGLDLADKGLAISPQEPVLLLWKSALLLLSSRGERGAESEDTERRGKELADNALRKNRFLEREREQIEAALGTE